MVASVQQAARANAPGTYTESWLAAHADVCCACVPHVGLASRRKLATVNMVCLLLMRRRLCNWYAKRFGMQVPPDLTMGVAASGAMPVIVRLL
ncbi:hypothetical protein AL486_10880 [Pandoraea apista]|nr:hypothetical protein SG18_15440 [Pandoraea apista]AKH73341.1 hypothetical protein XM39_15635 [Pandoraea apista]AKI61887.1 hypothetical protein AA956_08945 [Pandoraea apista]ALS64984.1 hypothetical protein AT395_08300 [Pandoraea apista]AVF40152.1 hypothetical protein AL486_10880 [Pandoraea apista]